MQLRLSTGEFSIAPAPKIVSLRPTVPTRPRKSNVCRGVIIVDLSSESPEARGLRDQLEGRSIRTAYHL